MERDTLIDKGLYSYYYSLINCNLFKCVQSVPHYLSEMAPYKLRGSLNVVFQLCITFGILIANVVNYLTPRGGKWTGLGGFGVGIIGLDI